SSIWESPSVCTGPRRFDFLENSFEGLRRKKYETGDLSKIDASAPKDILFDDESGQPENLLDQFKSSPGELSDDLLQACLWNFA
ncbi:15037_t:CDS:2, partial [Acaulospora colombiana]